jgi:CheY-like chemotaxis protein
MKLVSRRTPNSVPRADPDSRVFPSPKHQELLTEVNEPRVVRVLVVDDIPGVLTAHFRFASVIMQKTIEASKPSAKEHPILSSEIYVPENNRADLDVLDMPLDGLSEPRLATLARLINSASIGKTVSTETLTPHLQKLRTEARRQGAIDGFEAMLICAATPIDLVISDSDMLGANALHLIRSLNSLALKGYPDFRLPKVAVISGAFKDCSEAQLLEAGAAAVALKPLNMAEFASVIHYTMFGVLSADPNDCFELRE